MAAAPGRIQRGFHDLTQALALTVPTLRNVQSNLAWAADLISRSKKRGRK